MKNLTDFRNAGLVWAINKSLFHPYGFSMEVKFNDKTGEIVGWDITGDGSKPFFYSQEIEKAGFAKFSKFIEEQRTNIGD